MCVYIYVCMGFGAYLAVDGSGGRLQVVVGEVVRPQQKIMEKKILQEYYCQYTK